MGVAVIDYVLEMIMEGHIRLPLSAVKNPVLLRLFDRGLEDPPPDPWKEEPSGQIAIASAIYELAQDINDVELRQKIQKSASKSISASAEKMAIDT